MWMSLLSEDVDELTDYVSKRYVDEFTERI